MCFLWPQNPTSQQYTGLCVRMASVIPEAWSQSRRPWAGLAVWALVQPHWEVLCIHGKNKGRHSTVRKPWGRWSSVKGENLSRGSKLSESMPFCGRRKRKGLNTHLSLGNTWEINSNLFKNINKRSAIRRTQIAWTEPRSGSGALRCTFLCDSWLWNRTKVVCVWKSKTVQLEEFDQPLESEGTAKPCVAGLAWPQVSIAMVSHAHTCTRVYACHLLALNQLMYIRTPYS